MSDGRFGTSYVPECIINEQLKEKAGITDNYSYRLYLQKNAKKIMEYNAKNVQSSSKICDCPRCVLISEKKF